MEHDDYVASQEWEAELEQRANEDALLADLKNDQIKLEGENYDRAAFGFNARGSQSLFGSL